jgi:hypothetical protein
MEVSGDIPLEVDPAAPGGKGRGATGRGRGFCPADVLMTVPAALA